MAAEKWDELGPMQPITCRLIRQTVRKDAQNKDSLVEETFDVAGIHVCDI